MFTNIEIDIDSIPKVETVKLKPISKSYLKILYINIFIQYSILFGIVILAKNFIKEDWVSNVFWYAIIFLFLLLILQFVISILSFKNLTIVGRFDRQIFVDFINLFCDNQSCL